MRLTKRYSERNTERGQAPLFLCDTRCSSRFQKESPGLPPGPVINLKKPLVAVKVGLGELRRYCREIMHFWDRACSSFINFSVDGSLCPFPPRAWLNCLCQVQSSGQVTEVIVGPGHPQSMLLWAPNIVKVYEMFIAFLRLFMPYFSLQL